MIIKCSKCGSHLLKTDKVTDSQYQFCSDCITIIDSKKQWYDFGSNVIAPTGQTGWKAKARDSYIKYLEKK